MIHFLTYSNDNMTISRSRCAESAARYGANWVDEFSRADIDPGFYADNKAILDTQFCESGTRPCDGYWLWKPYLINKVMNTAQDGDIVVYVDAGCEIIAPLQEIVNVMDQDLFLFTNGMQHIHWCKADVYHTLLPGRGFNNAQDQQVQASALWIRVTPFSRKFIKEWLLWCQMPGMIDDSPSVLPNHPEFANHRYDQAILTCLQIKYGIRTHWWPDAKWFVSQRYRWPADQYPPMLIHHRKRNSDYDNR